MSDVFREVDEAVREDRLKQGAKRWGPPIVAAVVVIVAVTAGGVWWTNAARTAETARTAAFLAAANQPDAAGAIAELESIAVEGRGHLVGALARFTGAGVHLRRGERAEAVALYRGLAADGDLDPTWRDLALLYSVIHRLDDEAPATLEAELVPLLDPTSPWNASARELAALIALKDGRIESARAALTDLAEDVGVPQGLRTRARVLADGLGATVGAADQVEEGAPVEAVVE